MRRKNLILGVGGAIFLLLLGTTALWLRHRKISEIQKEIVRYERRAENFPDDEENYKKLSHLYGLLGREDLSEAYYKSYRITLALQREKNPAKRLRLSQERERQLEQIAKLKGGDPRNFVLGRSTGEESEKEPFEKESIGKGGENRPIEKKSPKSQTRAPSVRKPQKKPLSLAERMNKLFREGRREFEKERYTSAQEKFKKILTLNDNHSDAYAYLGAIHFESEKDIQRARALSQQALDRDTKNDKAYEVLGDLSRHEKDWNRAEEQYRRAIAFNGKNYLAYYKLGNLKAHQKEHIEASDLYRQSLKLNSRFHKAYLNYAFSELSRKKIAHAIELLRDSLSLPALREDRKRLFSTYSTLGYTYYITGEQRAAMDYYRKANAIEPSHKNYYHMGLISEARDRSVEARSYYQQALALKKDYDQARFNLATIYLNERRYRQALPLLQAVVEKNPRMVNALVNAGKCLAGLKQDEEAYVYFQRALHVEANDPTALLETARYWKRKREKNKAIEFGRDALKAEKIHRDRVIYYNELGLIYKQFNEKEEAEKAFREATTIDPKNVETLQNTADLYQEQERYTEAVGLYRRVIALNSRRYGAYEALGRLYGKMGDFKSAIDILNRLLRVNPRYENREEIKVLIDQLKK